MNISVCWLNRYLQPADLTADEAEQTLMSLGFPSETRTSLPDGDTRLDVEVTSNRGDVLCHVGMAREIAARSGRALVVPDTKPTAAGEVDASKCVRVINQTPRECPLFTARVIRGVRTGPSPAWLREALDAVGQRSISNVVDVTNFIALELGNPCHVFDLAKLAGASLVIRFARVNEPLTTLDGKKRVLAPDELVVADEQRAQSLAGVIGGADSQVSDGTTDVVLEMATWDPVTVRRAARRHAIRTDASYRFERIVDSRTIAAAADRAAALIVEVAGGTICRGVVAGGAGTPAQTTMRLRPKRVEAIMGAPVGAPDILTILRRLGVEVGPLGRGGDDMLCTAPAWRPDLTREIDLIEEVARVRGLDAVEIAPALPVTARAPQPTETARREIAGLLTGLGFYETVTFSFTGREAAQAFLPNVMSLIEVADERRKAEPACRPSVLPGLLACRRANQHAHVRPAGGVRLFETSAVFAQDSAGRSVESQKLALLMDVLFQGKSAGADEVQAGIRQLRGVIEALVRCAAGTRALLVFEAAAPHCPGFDPSAYAAISLEGAALGYLGLVARSQSVVYDLSGPVVAAELNLPLLIAAYPPRANLTLPPTFPSIERDVSFILPEAVTWDALLAEARAHAEAPMQDAAFVATFRGAQIGKGKKSVTMRLTFRDLSRTLRHEEADAPTAALVERVKARFGAAVRG